VSTPEPYVPHVPTPEEAWAALPYRPPLENLPIVRIDVAGPEPFNTLVVVRAGVWITERGWADGKLRFYRTPVPTDFTLIGFDPRVEPPVEHSTTVGLHLAETNDDTGFVVAADAADGAFDQQGRWVVTVDWANCWDQVYATARAYISSWVLCWEPPKPRRPWDGASPKVPFGKPWARLTETDVDVTRLDAGVARLARSMAARRRERAGRDECC
jgi:hypothetical protein